MARLQHRWSLRQGLVGLAALAALVPIAARADTVPAPDLNGVINVIVSTVPDGSFIDQTLGQAASKVATCVVQTYITRSVVAAEAGDGVSCGNVVVSTYSQATLCDNVFGNCAVSAPCSGTNACQNDVTMVPAPDTDGLTLTVHVIATARRGWTWANAPAGCRSSGATMTCNITQYSSGLLSPIVPVI